MSVSSSCLVYSRLKPSLVSVLISVLISVSISVPISIRGQTRYGLGLISKKPSSFKKKPSFIQEKTEFFSSENRGQNKRPLGFLRWQLNVLGVHDDDNSPCYVKHHSPYATSRSRMVNGMTFTTSPPSTSRCH